MKGQVGELSVFLSKTSERVPTDWLPKPCCALCRVWAPSKAVVAFALALALALALFACGLLVVVGLGKTCL